MYYVYEHLRNDTNEVFYVGKGKEYRANSTKNRNVYWKNVVKKANGFTVRFVAENIDDEELAYFCEEERIDQLKRRGVILTNLTIGGEGASGGENHHMYGKPHPRQGMPSILKGRYVGELNPMYGKPSPMLGKKNIGASLAHKGRERPIGGGKPAKAVIATNRQGVQTKFNSLSDASKFVGSDRHSIEKWCSINKVSKEYKWEFAK
jgi:hypothetical protein